MADKRHVRGTTMLMSKKMIFLSACIIALVGFVAGTKEEQLYQVVAPIFGMKVAHGSIDLSSLEQTYKLLSANYDGTLNTQALINGANKGLVSAAGDKFTIYMDKSDATAFNNDLTGDIGGGIGAVIGVQNGQPTIISVLPDNPAEKAGLKGNEMIVTLDGVSTKGWDANKTASKVRGKVGTVLHMTVRLRDGTEKTYSIERATINDPSVMSTIENGIGILTVSRFDDQTGSLAKKAAENFRAKHVRGVILDLRDNGGGYLSAAPQVAGLWLDNQLVVSEKTDGTVTNQLYSGGNPILAGLKTVVLVNGNTASAAEVVTDALKDYGVATIMGETTYGKGSVQEIISVANGAQLKVTVAHWYPPKGPNVGGHGITPSVIVKESDMNIQKGIDDQMNAAKAQFGAN